MRLLIPLLDLKSRLSHLESAFFFLKHGIDDAIIHTLEEYEYPRNKFQSDIFVCNYTNNFIMDEFDRHMDNLSLSNSTYRQLNNIYNILQLAISTVRVEVNNEFKCLVGDKALKVKHAKQLSRFDCIVHVDFELNNE